MTLPIRTLPIVENWDCRGCGSCCRTLTIVLDRADLDLLRNQRWDRQPDFRGVKTVIRESLLGGKHVLAKKPDGSCVFLSDEGRCRIHEAHGADAKPAVCRMFPYQLVSLGRFTHLTLRRSCPSAAADHGRPLKEHVAALNKSGLISRFSDSRTSLPTVARGARRSWQDFLAAGDALMRLSTDDRLPLVRRLVHGLRFCTLLEECKLASVDEASFGELIQLLEGAATEGASEFFRERKPATAATTLLFRQLAVHYIRTHPSFPVCNRWRDRWRLMWLSAKFARGKGEVPAIHPEFPSTTFERLERPLGPLSTAVTLPLNRFFETHVTSQAYAVVGHRRSLVTSYRALVLAYPMALWLLRLAVGDREPSATDVIDMVVALERGQGTAALARCASTMSSTQQLERLVAWYAR